MAYNLDLADRLREHLGKYPELLIEEKRMFGGLAFMVNDKMCINVSKDKLMCRHDPERLEELQEVIGFEPMFMKGREFKGYCLVNEEGYSSQKDFEFWLDVCLSYNDRAKRSKRKKQKT